MNLVEGHYEIIINIYYATEVRLRETINIDINTGESITVLMYVC
jgi:hypothetical protein